MRVNSNILLASLLSNNFEYIAYVMRNIGLQEKILDSAKLARQIFLQIGFDFVHCLLLTKGY